MIATNTSKAAGMIAPPMPVSRTNICTNTAPAMVHPAFHYDYDVHGNWIKKVVEARGGADQDFAVFTIEQRTFAYDD
jgi:hypothetical protein